jgi:hypothetical protein
VTGLGGKIANFTGPKWLRSFLTYAAAYLTKLHFEGGNWLLSGSQWYTPVGLKCSLPNCAGVETSEPRRSALTTVHNRRGPTLIWDPCRYRVDKHRLTAPSPSWCYSRWCASDRMRMPRDKETRVTSDSPSGGCCRRLRPTATSLLVAKTLDGAGQTCLTDSTA